MNCPRQSLHSTPGDVIIIICLTHRDSFSRQKTRKVDILPEGGFCFLPFLPLPSSGSGNYSQKSLRRLPRPITQRLSPVLAPLDKQNPRICTFPATHRSWPRLSNICITKGFSRSPRPNVCPPATTLIVVVGSGRRVALIKFHHGPGECEESLLRLHRSFLPLN